MKTPHAIRDSIHGYVRLSDLEIEGIDTRELQRLRGISQLGLTERVYPGARHSRFEHALGTLEVATRILEDLRARLGLEGLLAPLGLSPQRSEYDRLLQITRWVALLHDVGHTPFSHGTEHLLPGGVGHEAWTAKLVSGGQVGDVIRGHDPELLEDVLRVLRVAHKTRSKLPPALAFARELIAGEIGADRMDYLLRDSAATGVRYGVFDLGRVLHTVVPIIEPEKNPTLGVERGGVLAVEGLLWSRVSMFEQVYYHRTRRILDRHLGNFLKVAVGTYPAEHVEYLAWNDARVWELLRTRSLEAKLPGARDARRILERKQHRALPQEIQAADGKHVRQWIESWANHVRREQPEADPIGDIVPPPASEPGVTVLEPTGDLSSWEDVSSAKVPTRRRLLGRLYVDRDTPSVPDFP